VFSANPSSCSTLRRQAPNFIERCETPRQSPILPAFAHYVPGCKTDICYEGSRKTASSAAFRESPPETLH